MPAVALYYYLLIPYCVVPVATGLANWTDSVVDEISHVQTANHDIGNWVAWFGAVLITPIWDFVVAVVDWLINLPVNFFSWITEGLSSFAEHHTVAMIVTLCILAIAVVQMIVEEINLRCYIQHQDPARFNLEM